MLLPRLWIRPIAAFACALGFAGGFVAAALLFWKTGTPSLEVADAISRDRLAAFTQMIVAGSGLLAVGISYSSRRRVEHVGEYYALLATCGGGMAFLVSASNLMTLFLGLEWFSVCLYVLCAMDLDSRPIARGRAQVPDRRQLRLRRPALRLGARLRSHGRARLRGDRRRGSGHGARG